MAAADNLKQAREHLRDREWPKSREILRAMFPASVNTKFIGDLMRTATAALRTNEYDVVEQSLWLAIEIYESGRDENADVLTAIRMLADMYTKAQRNSELQILSNRTFMLVLVASEGLLRSVKSLTKQLQDAERPR